MGIVRQTGRWLVAQMVRTGYLTCELVVALVMMQAVFDGYDWLSPV